MQRLIPDADLGLNSDSVVLLCKNSTRNQSRHLVGVVCSTGEDVDAYRRLGDIIGWFSLVQTHRLCYTRAKLSCGRSDAPLIKLRVNAKLSSLVSSAGL